VRRLFRRIFNVHPEEVPQFTVLSIIYFVFIIGLVWSENVIRAEVVKADRLANAQLLSSIFVVVASIVYTAYVDRIPKNRMVLILGVFGIIGTVSVTGAIIVSQGAFDEIGYLSLFILHRFFFFIWVIHWFTYIIDLYDTQAAKRIFPLLSAARPFATMIAGFSFAPITGLLPVDLSHITIIVIWIAILIASTALFALLPFILEMRGVAEEPLTRRSAVSNQTETSGIKSLVEGLQYVGASSFLRWMAISALVLIAVNTIVEFRVAELIFQLDSIDGDQTKFATYTATIDGITNVFVLIFQFTVFNIILRRIGLGNMNLIYPILVLGVGISLVVVPSVGPEFLIAIAATYGYSNYRGVRRVVRDPVFALLNNAVPLHAKGRARSVINAILSPTGGILAGALLTFITALPEWVLPVALIAGCLIYLIASLILRREYTKATVEMLEQNSFSFLLSQRNEIGVTDSATMQILANNIKASPDPEFKVFMASIIAEIGGRDALPILTDMVRQADGSYQRDLVEVIYHTDIRTEEMRLLYEELLGDDDPRIREIAITGLGRVIGTFELDYIALIQPLLGDDDIDVKATTITALIRSNQEPYNKQAEQYLTELLRNNNPAERFVALEILGKLEDIQRVRALVPYLEDINDEVRLQATESIIQLWTDDVPRDIYDLIADRVTFFMDDRVERVRLAELELLARIDVTDSVNALIRALGDTSPRVRDVAIQSLARIGPSVVGQLLELAKSGQDLQNKMATITLSVINNDEYGGLLDRYIEATVGRIYRNYNRLNALEMCHNYSSVVILENSISRELNEQIDDTFELMSYRFQSGSLDLIKESLKSPDSRTRSNAQEALESVTTPQLSRRISPMLNPSMTTKVLANMNDEKELETFDVLLDIARGDDDWLRAVTLYAFGEIGRNHPDISKIWPELEQNSDLTVEIDPCQRMLKMDAVAVSLRFSAQKDDLMVKLAARAALRYMRGESILDHARESLEESVLSIVERMIFLKKVTFFQGVSVDQLKVLSSICEEELYNADDVIFREGDRGDSLYIVVNGIVSIGIFSKSSDNFTELAAYRSNSAFGEMTIFDYSPRSASAVAKTDVLLLRLRSEPLLALIYQEPDLSIELLRSMSDNLRNANSRIASLTSTMRKTF